MHQVMLLRFKYVFHLSYLPLNLLLIPELIMAPGIASSSELLSWPHGTEFVDSYLKLRTFALPSFWLSHSDSCFSWSFDNIPFSILQSLAGIDYRKSLIADRILWELSGSSSGAVFGISATTQTLSHTVYTPVNLILWFPLYLFRYVSTMVTWNWINSPIVRCSINWRKKRSSGHIFLSLVRVVLQLFFVLSPAEIQLKGTAGFVKLDMEKIRWYGIGNLIGRSNILTSSDPLTMRRL